jgi:pyruvate ferredoxin oxidoreductase delta subunit
MTRCECGECLSAYFCPEGAISWQDNVIRFDYNFCKTCGTCARECVFNCITMVDVSTALKTQEEKGASA